MSSKRRITWTAGWIIATLAALAILPGNPASAARRYDESTLKGTYHFTITEVRREAGLLVHCNAYGRIEFDGSGGATVDGTLGYGLCRDEDGTPVFGDSVEDGCFTYTVDESGSVQLTELDDYPVCEDPGPGYQTHCQILDNGKLLLCDGSGGFPGAVLPEEVVSWTAVARKL